MSKKTTPKTTKAKAARTSAKAKQPAPKRTAKADAKTKKMSALDAAAQVLASAKEPMAAKPLIEAMAAKGLWTSPGGKTPHATLYAAMLREINEKGKEARFQKVDRGQFTLNK